MASQFQKGEFNFREPARAVYLNLFEPRAFQGPNGKDNGDPKYSANFLLPPTGAVAQDLKGAAVAIAKAQWPGRSLSDLKFPWDKGDVLADRAKNRGKDLEFYRGFIIVSARGKFPPRLASIQNNRIVEFDGQDERRLTLKANFWPGVETLALFTLQAYNGVGANPDGVTAYLDGVTSLNRGERIQGSGGRSMAETFSGYVGLTTNESATEGLDEEVGF